MPILPGGKERAGVRSLGDNTIGLAYLLGAIWLLGSQWGQSARSRNDESSCGPIHTQKQRTHTSSRMAATESGPTSSVNG